MPNPHLQDEFENEGGEGEEQEQPPPPLEARQERARVVVPRGGNLANRPVNKRYANLPSEPVLPPEELASRPNTRLNLARQAYAARMALAPSDQINLLQAITSASWAVKQASSINQPPSVYEKVGGIVEGPSFISDEYGLPWNSQASLSQSG